MSRRPRYTPKQRRMNAEDRKTILRYAKPSTRGAIARDLMRLEALLQRMPQDHLERKDLLLALELFCNKTLRYTAFEFAPEHLLNRVFEMEDSDPTVIRAALEMLADNGSLKHGHRDGYYAWGLPGEGEYDDAAAIDADIVLACLRRL